MDSRLEETKNFFDEKADTWDNESIYSPNLIKAVVEISGIPQNGRVIDIACGTGVLFPFILEKEPSELFGIDISDKMLEKAAKKFPSPSVRLQSGDFMDIKEDCFDIAFVYRAYPHFPDKKAFAKKLHTILKTNGRFVIAHTESRAAINQRHKKGAMHVSDILLPIEEEAVYFNGLFDIDIKADTDNIYIISGKRK